MAGGEAGPGLYTLENPDTRHLVTCHHLIVLSRATHLWRG